MKNSTYNSVPVIASVIGSKSRKSMYLVNITSLDGSTIYKNSWIPTSWQSNTSTPEWRYSSKRFGYTNKQVFPGKYYYFNFDESVLMTEQGPVNSFGSPLSVEGLVKIQNKKRINIEWEEYGQELVEFPMSQSSDAMLIDRYSKTNVTIIKQRLVNNKIQEYLQLTDRFIIHIPTWMMKNLEVKYKMTQSIQEDIFENDDDFETIIEKTSKDSMIQEEFSYIDRREMGFEVIDSLTQWELDNPEYV